jgi:hypothetical protein
MDREPRLTDPIFNTTVSGAQDGQGELGRAVETRPSWSAPGA